jgi:hypothetical protein
MYSFWQVGCFGFDTLLAACRFARDVSRQYDIPAEVYHCPAGRADKVKVCTFFGYRRAARPGAPPTPTHTGGTHAFD